MTKKGVLSDLVQSSDNSQQKLLKKHKKSSRPREPDSDSKAGLLKNEQVYLSGFDNSNSSYLASGGSKLTKAREKTKDARSSKHKSQKLQQNLMSEPSDDDVYPPSERTHRSRSRHRSPNRHKSKEKKTRSKSRKKH